MPGVGKVQDISPEVASGLQRKMVALYIQMCQRNSTYIQLSYSTSLSLTALGS